MQSVLVLNKLYLPVHITNWQKCVNLIYTDHARAVDPEDYRAYNFNDWAELSKIKAEANQHNGMVVHSQKLTIIVPEVIALVFYDKLPPQEVILTRESVFARDKLHCQYCGERYSKKELTWDHVIPLNQGGKNSWENLVTCCYRCNQKKGGHSPKEAGMTLIARPTKPKWHGELGLRLGVEIPVKESWQKFLDRVYWKLPLEDDK